MIDVVQTLPPKPRGGSTGRRRPGAHQDPVACKHGVFQDAVDVWRRLSHPRTLDRTREVACCSRSQIMWPPSSRARGQRDVVMLDDVQTFPQLL